jgi:hypothetical protein
MKKVRKCLLTSMEQYADKNNSSTLDLTTSRIQARYVSMLQATPETKYSSKTKTNGVIHSTHIHNSLQMSLLRQFIINISSYWL